MKTDGPIQIWQVKVAPLKTHKISTRQQHEESSTSKQQKKTPMTLQDGKEWDIAMALQNNPVPIEECPKEVKISMCQGNSWT